jgi:hypothetical protein
MKEKNYKTGKRKNSCLNRKTLLEKPSSQVKLVIDNLPVKSAVCCRRLVQKAGQGSPAYSAANAFHKFHAVKKKKEKKKKRLRW